MWRCKKCNGEVVMESVVPTAITKRIKENGTGGMKFNEQKFKTTLSEKYYCILCKKETKKDLKEIAEWIEEE